jgi:hypothetical protein
MADVRCQMLDVSEGCALAREYFNIAGRVARAVLYLVTPLIKAVKKHNDGKSAGRAN